MEPSQVKVGLGLLVVKDGQILLGKRKGSHGAGEYSGPGGHLEPLERLEDSLLREVAEEVGPAFKVKNLRFLCVSNITNYAPKHYVDIGMTAVWEAGEPQVMEPDKQEGWDWYDMESPPSPLMPNVALYIQAYKTGKVYFDAK